MNGWTPVTRRDPCPICGGPDNCTRSTDGRYAYCGRISEGSTKQNNGGQWLHVLDDSHSPVDWLRANPRPPGLVNASSPKEQPSRDWGQVSRSAFHSPNADLARRELATTLCVSVESLERLGIGYSGRVLGWTVPERDASGQVIGINRRLPDGSKRRDKGSRSGLTFDPVRWMDPDADTIYLVEGCSDVAAMLTMGFCAVGRPSNLGGVELLGELLKSVPTDRRIAVIGERDRKPHHSLAPATRSKHKPDCPHCSTCWPGWFGATRTAEQLASILGREVAWTLPPEGFKDVREWLRAEEKAKDGS